MRFALLAVALCLAACAPQETAPCAPAASKPAQDIAEAEAGFRKAVEAKDGDAAAAFFVDENPPGTPASASLGEAMRQSLKALAADPNGKASFRQDAPAAQSATGDLAYSLGVLDWVATYPETRTPLARSAAYLFVWRAQADGTWKIVRAVANDVPYESPYRRYENGAAKGLN